LVSTQFLLRKWGLRPIAAKIRHLLRKTALCAIASEVGHLLLRLEDAVVSLAAITAYFGPLHSLLELRRLLSALLLPSRRSFALPLWWR
jgi:hypothetical protein